MPNDDLIIPKNGSKADWEVELAVVIEKNAGYVDREEALEYVAGYVPHNDYSEGVFQLERGGQWVKGKSADTFAPLGPFLATRDEIPDTGQLRQLIHDVAARRCHQHYLRAEDVVELGIDKLGESRQTVVAWQPRTGDLAHTAKMRLGRRVVRSALR